jgi:hypothetical protein
MNGCIIRKRTYWLFAQSLMVHNKLDLTLYINVYYFIFILFAMYVANKMQHN